jgi:hypothetical protein
MHGLLPPFQSLPSVKSTSVISSSADTWLWQEDANDVAQALGLVEENDGEEHLMLLQMPSLLPTPRPLHDAADAKRGHPKHVRQRPVQLAASLKDLPSGKVSASLFNRGFQTKLSEWSRLVPEACIPLLLPSALGMYFCSLLLLQ